MALLASNVSHPDLVDLLIERAERQRTVATEVNPLHLAAALATPITADQIVLLQQRTILDHSTLLEGSRQESAVLARFRLGGADQLILAVVARSGEDEPWRFAQVRTKVLDLEAPNPYKGAVLGGMGRHVVGGVVTSPEIAAIRLVLADATVLAESVSNGSALLFASLHTPNQWAKEATFELVDREGTVVFSEKHWVNPYGPPPPGHRLNQGPTSS